jgi:hypothetical protein
MVRDAETASGTRAASRRRRNHGRAAIWRAFRDRLLATALAGTFLAGPDITHAQMGQTAMAPAGGVVNRAVQGFKELNENGPGMLYYGINAADRGLGYRGSYMTLGAFVPGFEDDLGGYWAADLRSHLSVYGGFFSNVGAVRKQFLGGSLLGIGVYWDYDGDLNQYDDYVFPGTDTVFSGGQVYNQVGISGEWLTDFGNLRSNGYIPVGTTAEYVGPFVDNFVLCQNGMNAGLAGTDLEIGVYVPGLNDWAGMISVGGYAYGNARYDYADGQDVVPWFGGVYTRLDMTFIENWDFSLQYNNDSYFDSTGFARLTYRMGGSRRRNVPDQMEQPMMRNEHVVRAHQAPIVAVNPETGTPWRVFHVDNAGSGVGNGTAQSPYTSLAAAQGAATNPYDIVYVRRGISATNPYVTPVAGYSFSAPNQYFIGEGSGLAIPTLSCGGRSFFAGSVSSAYPVLTNPLAAAIVVNQPGTVVDHFQIVGSRVGISDGSGFLSGVASISDVIITGNGPGQRGVEIANSTGTFNFDRMQLNDLTNDGFVISAANGDVNITNSTITGVEGNGVLVTGAGTRVDVATSTVVGTLGSAVNAAGPGSEVTIASTTIADTRGDAIVASGSAAAIGIESVDILRTEGSAIVASGNNALIYGKGVRVLTTGSDGVVVSGEAANVVLVSSTFRAVDGFGALVSGSAAGLFLTDRSAIIDASSDGLHVIGDQARVLVEDSRITNSAVNGVYVDNRLNSGESQVSLLRADIDGAGGSGVFAEGVSGTNGVVQIFASRIANTSVAGVSSNGSNIDIGRDPTVVGGTGSVITNAGGWGIFSAVDSKIRVQNTSISGVVTGIEVDGNPGPTANPLTSPANNITAISNTISVTGSTGILITANHVPQPGVPTTYANGLLLQNRITASGSAGAVTGIALVTTNPTSPPSVLPSIVISSAISPENLSQLNLGTPVVESPRPEVGWDFGPATPWPARIPPELPPTPAVPAVP